jgi:hypothetical protein
VTAPERTPSWVLETILDTRIPTLSPASRSVLRKLVADRGTFDDAGAFARAVGLRDRHQLAYTLRCDALRPLSVLAAWVRVALWLAEVEDGGTSLCQAALAEAHDPGIRYRLVKRLTGLGWPEVQSRGLVWLVEELVQSCTLPAGRTEPVDRRTAG